MNISNLTHEEKIIKAKILMQKSTPFFSYLVSNLKIKECLEIDTIGIDSYNVEINNRGELIYNPEFINKLNIGEIQTLLTHEVFHPIFNHFSRGKNLNHEVFNIAGDLVINTILKSNGFTFTGLLSNGVIPDSEGNFKYKNILIENILEKNAEEIYYILIKEELNEKDKSELKGFDSHNYKDTENNTDDKIEEIKKQWEKIVIEGKVFNDIKNKSDDIKGLNRLFDKIINPSLNWKVILRNMVNNEISSDYTYNRLNKRGLALGYYLPSLKKENLNISVAVDVSGSINKEDLNKFMSEVYGILNSFEQITLNLMFIDTKINNHYVLNKISKEDLLKLNIGGGGGTDFKEIYNYVGEKLPSTKLLIFFTDGYASFPSEEIYKTLWILTKEHNKNIPFGEKTILED